MHSYISLRSCSVPSHSNMTCLASSATNCSHSSHDLILMSWSLKLKSSDLSRLVLHNRSLIDLVQRACPDSCQMFVSILCVNEHNLLGPLRCLDHLVLSLFTLKSFECVRLTYLKPLSHQLATSGDVLATNNFGHIANASPDIVSALPLHRQRSSALVNASSSLAIFLECSKKSLSVANRRQ